MKNSTILVIMFFTWAMSRNVLADIQFHVPQSDDKVAIPAKILPGAKGPAYPAAARAAGVAGIVGMHLIIADDGSISRCDIAISSGHGVLDEAAKKAVCSWRFEPARDVNGEPISSEAKFPIRFTFSK